MQQIGYQYNVMKLLEYDEENKPRSQRVSCWKIYVERVTDEIRQLRERMSSGFKNSCAQNE